MDNETTYAENIIEEAPTAAQKVFKFNHEVSVEFKIRSSDVNSMINVGRLKEYIYQEAIKNLMKKTKFLQLYIQLIERQISEIEYEKELTQNTDKYVIDIKDINPGLDTTALLLVLKSLPYNFTVDEVTEVFGVKSQSLLEGINQ